LGSIGVSCGGNHAYHVWPGVRGLAFGRSRKKKGPNWEGQAAQKGSVISSLFKALGRVEKCRRKRDLGNVAGVRREWVVWPLGFIGKGVESKWWGNWTYPRQLKGSSGRKSVKGKGKS